MPQNRRQTDRRPAVVLVSGGMDSATTLAIARAEGYSCLALTFRYGQRHSVEIEAARHVAASLGAQVHRIIDIDLRAIGASALTDDSLAVPKDDLSGRIPVTYVPARNTIFLSYALAMAEASGARHIFIGVTAVDYSGYPDCRPAFIHAFQEVANLGTKAGIEGDRFTINTPLINLSKAQIIQRGNELGVEYSLTISCYDPDPEGRACGRCDSCHFRRRGFAAAGVADPTRYVEEVSL